MVHSTTAHVKKTKVEIDRGIAITLYEWSDVVATFGTDIVLAVGRAIWKDTETQLSGRYVSLMISEPAFRIVHAHAVVFADQQHMMT